MFSIEQSDAPFTIDVMKGITFTVRPMDSYDMEVAQADARITMARLEKSLQDVFEAGLIPSKEIDLKNPAERDALYQSLVTGALAERHILSWEGVDTEVDVPNAKRMAVRVFPVGQIFYSRLTQHYLKVLEAKKDCAAAPNGTSSEVAEKNIAKAVSKTN